LAHRAKAVRAPALRHLASTKLVLDPCVGAGGS